MLSTCIMYVSYGIKHSAGDHYLGLFELILGLGLPLSQCSLFGLSNPLQNVLISLFRMLLALKQEPLLSSQTLQMQYPKFGCRCISQFLLVFQYDPPLLPILVISKPQNLQFSQP